MYSPWSSESPAILEKQHDHDPPSSSVDLQEPKAGSTTDPSTIQSKTIEQQPDEGTESDIVRLTDPQKPCTTDGAVSKQQYTDQKPDASRASTNIGGAHPLPNPPPRLFALIIGINKYKSPDITTLSGAVPDADAVRDYLQEYLGVPSTRIKYLRDSEATRAAIINQIKALSLSDSDIEEGDPILIYYAGHGGSAETPKGWEIGSSGRIEFLIPYDYSRLEDGRGNYKHGIPDRTLGALLSDLASKKGDNITVILDCCHSGSGTRNYKDPTELVRGIEVGNIPSDLDQDLWSGFESSKDVIGRGSLIHSGFTRKGLRSHVLLAACRAEELAYERTSRGVFTVALLKALMDIGIHKLSYASLFDLRMPPLSSGQSPQCEGVHRNRFMFNGKAPGKSISYYKIREVGQRYEMPDVGIARGITLGAEFEVYRDQDSGQLLGIVVASELGPFSTTLDAKEPRARFALEREGVALQISAGTEEHVLRIHVANEGLKDLVRKIDPSQRFIRLVERVHQAEFGMVLENGKVVFNIFDSVVAKHGLTRMPFTLEPTLDAISPVIRAADHFYWHLRRAFRLETDTEIGLATSVEIEVAELEHDDTTYDDDLEPVLSPTQAGWKRGKDFDLQIKDKGTIYGWNIINNRNLALYPALFYFDNSDWSITSYYQPPTARGIVDPPLKGHRFLPVGYGDSGSVPHAFYLRKGQSVDVGFLKLFLSKNQVDLSDVAQPSPFTSVGGRYTAPAEVKVRKLRLQWDSILIPVVQRRANK